MKYPLSLEYYRKQLKVVKHDAIMRFELLEQLLTKNKLEKYLAIKKKVKNSTNAQVRGFNLLFNGILNDKISDLDIEIYCNNFEPNQHIKYYREYFKSTKETENYSPKGTTVELKAYGDSKKINREVIAFTGSFRDNLLHSFSDKTSEAQSFTTKETKDTDYYENDINLIKLLLENDLLEILSDTSLNSILNADAKTFFLLYNENKLGLVNPKTINQLARFHKEVFEFLFKKRELKILSTETIKYQVDKETSEINSNVNEVLTLVKKVAFLYDKQDCFYVKKYETPESIRVGEEHRFENNFSTYLKVDEIIETFENKMNMKSYFINRNNITEEDKIYLQTLYKSDIDDKIKAVIAKIKETIHERIESAKKENSSNKRIGVITVVVIFIILFLIWNWLTN